tara:strand:+ start:81 stop:551 length:471 start_codon:yes stop_codon:yes gene_type:complete
MSLFIGGTTSVNEFDDYETGTFTATVYWSANNTTGGYTNTSTETGRYTKIGRCVEIGVRVNPHSYNSGSNCWIVGVSLPFTVTNDKYATMCAYSGRGNYGGSLNTSTYNRTYATFSAGTNQIRLFVTGHGHGAGFYGHYSGTVVSYAQIGGIYETS